MGNTTAVSCLRARNDEGRRRIFLPLGGYSVIAVILFLLIWQGLSSCRVVNPFYLPGPLAILKSMAEAFASGEMVLHSKATLFRIMVGFCIGSSFGVALGILAGWFPKFYQIINPFVAATYPLPKIAILPLIIVYLGIGEQARILIISLAVFYIALVNTYAGVKNVEPTLIMAASNLGANTSQIFVKVILPGAMPMIAAGLRLGLGIAFLSAVMTEMIFANYGLGYYITNKGTLMDMCGVFGGLAVLALLSILFTFLMEWIISRLMPWSRNIRPIR